MSTSTTSPALLQKMDAYWRAVNDLSVGQCERSTARNYCLSVGLYPIGHKPAWPYIHVSGQLRKYSFLMLTLPPKNNTTTAR